MPNPWSALLHSYVMVGVTPSAFQYIDDRPLGGVCFFLSEVSSENSIQSTPFMHRVKRRGSFRFGVFIFISPANAFAISSIDRSFAQLYFCFLWLKITIYSARTGRYIRFLKHFHEIISSKSGSMGIEQASRVIVTHICQRPLSIRSLAQSIRKAAKRVVLSASVSC